MAVAFKHLQRVGDSTGLVLSPEIQAERGKIIISPRSPAREAVIQAAEAVIARYDDVFRRLAL